MEEICLKCGKVRKDGTCMVYTVPPHAFVSHNECPFNKKKVEVKKHKVRVGQQKQKKRG